MLCHPGHGDEVEGAGAEAVGGARQGSHGADLDDVPGEVGGERPARLVRLAGLERARGESLGHARRPAGADAARRRRLGAAAVGVGEVQDPRVEVSDLRAVERADLEARAAAAPALEGDEGVAGDLRLEARAPLAQDAPVAVQEDLGGDLDGLGVGALDVDEPRALPPVRERLILQRALAALVAHRAVERVVDEEELDHAPLGLAGHLGGVLRVDLHAGADGLGAGRDGLGALGHDPVAPGPGDFDQALPARGDGLEQRVVAEARDPHADPLGGADDERPGGNRHLLAVDREVDELDRLLDSLLLDRHRTATSPKSVVFS